MDNPTLKRGLEFSTNFTIPRKQLKEDNSASYPQYHPLNNVYEMEQGNNYANQTYLSKFDQAQLATVAKTIVPFLNSSEGQQKLLHKEVPKTGTPSETKYKDTFPHLTDPTLPQELTMQFQPLFCKLCECQHTSNIMAKLHYNSKKHAKKVRNFLIEYSKRTGEPLHPKASTPEKPDDNNPRYFYCDSCDLPLTGRLHAESHYSSRNHRRVILGMSAPAGKGQYDNDGNWNRTSTIVPKERDNFGVDFALPSEVVVQKQQQREGIHCDICNVYVTSDQQMTIHINGTKHKKKLKQQEELNTGQVVKSSDMIVSNPTQTSVGKMDLSAFRTPSGFYYCNPCDLTLNSKTQFQQHLDSKKHKKKASAANE